MRHHSFFRTSAGQAMLGVLSIVASASVLSGAVADPSRPNSLRRTAVVGGDEESIIMSSVMAPAAMIDPGSKVLIEDQRQRSSRGLQSNSRLWDISEPAISYTGMQLDLEHTVRDQIRTNNVRIELFRNDDCSFSIDDNDYLSVDIVNDLTAFGDGSGTRKVRCFLE